MAPAPRRRLGWATALVGAAVLAMTWYYSRVELRTAGTHGFPLDDSWIHLQFARNFAAGHPFRYSDNALVPGSTAPLWTIVLGSAIGLAPAHPVLVAKVLGVTFLLASVLLTFYLARSIFDDEAIAVAAMVYTAFVPQLTWASLSGMEVTFYLALMLAAMLAYFAYRDERDRRILLSTMLCALAAMARPEAFMLFGFALADQIVLAWLSSDCAVRKSLVGRLLPQIGLYAALTAPFFAFNWLTSGHPFPTTFYAKVGQRGLLAAIGARDLHELAVSLFGYPTLYLDYLLRFEYDVSALLLMGLLPGLLGLIAEIRQKRERNRGLFVLMAFLVYPLVMGAVRPASGIALQHGRYMANLTVLFVAIGAAGIITLGRLVRLRAATAIVLLLVLVRLVSQDVKFARTYAVMVQNIEQMQVNIGRWVADHTAPDAVVAANDIGALAYFSRRRVLDLVGIGTPEALPFVARGDVLSFLDAKRPDYLIIFPTWFPSLAARTDLFFEAARFTVENNLAFHNKTMIVYETIWHRRRLGHPRSDAALHEARTWRKS